MLKFSYGNSKLNKLARYFGFPYNRVVCFDLPAGYTCPGANICQSFANRETGYITDGKNCKVRCYATSGEALSPQARKLRWHNFDTLRSCNSMVNEILSSIPKQAKIIRLHSSGDFFNEEYFRAWAKVSEIRYDLVIFGYTKMATFLANMELDKGRLKLIYSHGGLFDEVRHDFPTCFIETGNLYPDVPLACHDNDYDDYHYITEYRISFKLAVHGTQPKKK